MLILTRRCGETIHIGDDVTVTIVRMRDKFVHVGIVAPKHVQVHREEIYRRILREHAGAQPLLLDE